MKKGAEMRIPKTERWLMVEDPGDIVSSPYSAMKGFGWPCVRTVVVLRRKGSK